MISIEGVSKTYPGGTQALAPTTLHIPSGQFVCLLGPSGCGKTTLLNVLAGLESPTGGSVRHLGKVGVVFQEAALFPWRTVRENVAFGLQMQGMPRRERLERADAMLDLVHLGKFPDAYPHELSGGMRQRVAIARALVLEPNLLLMDEPFGALDAQTRSLLQGELATLWMRTRCTVVFVTHSLNEALVLADRILLFSTSPGRVIGDYHLDAPRPRDPVGHPVLARVHRELRERLGRIVQRAAAGANTDDSDHELDETLLGIDI
ncbi:MAG: ABC transporter ATP-binding protein [Armatimonadota bacterium]